MEIDIKEVIVLVTEYDMDKVIIHTNNLPATVYPWYQQGSLVMDVGKGQGTQYVRDVFKVEPRVIECPCGCEYYEPDEQLDED